VNTSALSNIKHLILKLAVNLERDLTI